MRRHASWGSRALLGLRSMLLQTKAWALEQLKKALLYDLLTGRVRVRDAATAAAS